MKNKILLLVVLSLLFAGCGNTLNLEDITTCKDGKYSANSEQKELAKENGMKIDYIKLKSWNDAGNYKHCSVTMILKKPVLMMGSMVKTIPIYSDCNVRSMEHIQELGRDPLQGCN